MSETLKFVVPGEPRGKGRPRFARMGKFVRAYTDQKTASFENLVALAFKADHPGVPMIPAGVPISIRVTAVWLHPASWSAKKKLASRYRTSKPDADNLLKAVCDGLNGVAFADDSQIVMADVSKVYDATSTGTIVTISRLE